MLPVVFTFVTLISLGSAAELTTCHLREMDICMASLIVFTNGEKGIAANDAELDRQCGFVIESVECMENYTNTCLGDAQLDLLDPIIDTLFNYQEQFCKRNSSLRQKLLKHSACAKAVARNQKNCINDLQTAFEYINSNFNSTMKVDLSCCAYWRNRNCTRELATKHCAEGEADGPDGLNTFNDDLDQRMGWRMMHIYCGEYKPGINPICDQLPAPGTPYERPKNKKLRSILTRMLKAYTSYLN